MKPITRVQGNIVARQERRFLNWACSVMPSGITSDHLTAFGVFGAFLVLAGYLGARAHAGFLWLAVAGYVIHWFGDSLDGSLARHRNASRPRYGYFLDHSVDAFCILLMIGGMGLTPWVRLDVALFMVVGYFALSIHVFLRNTVTGTFQLSFMALGPTEMRMIFVALTVWMFVTNGVSAHGPVALLSDFDVVLLGIAGVFMALFCINTAGMLRKLRAEEGDGRVPVASAPLAPALGGLDLSRKAAALARAVEVAATPEPALRPATSGSTGY